MKTAIFVVLLLTVSWTHCVRSQLPLDTDFNCQQNATPHELNLTALAGYWYEAARAPNVDAMKCLNVSVPATVNGVTNNLELELEYITTIDKKEQAMKETIKFPWDEKTANGTFVLEYKGPELNVTVTYRVVYSDPKFMTILCGYAGFSPIPLFKLLTRQRQLDPLYVKYINQQVNQAGLQGNLIWTEQSPDRCNAAVHPTTGALTILAVAIVWCLLRCD